MPSPPLQKRLLAQLLVAKVVLPSRQPLVEEIREQQQLQLLSVVDQEELPLYRFWLQVVALERQQLHHQLLQHIHHHDIYPTSKPLTMRHLL